MNPYPLVGLNHFTVPVAISASNIGGVTYGGLPDTTRAAGSHLPIRPSGAESLTREGDDKTTVEKMRDSLLGARFLARGRTARRNSSSPMTSGLLPPDDGCALSLPVVRCRRVPRHPPIASGAGGNRMRRREFIGLVAGAVTAFPAAANAAELYPTRP